MIDVDPWPPAHRGRSRRKATRVSKSVSVRSLPDPETMARAIDAIASHQPASRTYQVMTAVAYYAGLRPSEVVMLRAKALHLPARVWGRIDVTEADVAFDEPGEPKTGPRSVPIPPRAGRFAAGVGRRARPARRRPAVPNAQRRPPDVVELVPRPAARPEGDPALVDAHLRLPPRGCDDVVASGSASRRGRQADGSQRRHAGVHIRRSARGRRGGRQPTDRCGARRRRSEHGPATERYIVIERTPRIRLTPIPDSGVLVVRGDEHDPKLLADERVPVPRAVLGVGPVRRLRLPPPTTRRSTRSARHAPVGSRSSWCPSRRSAGSGSRGRADVPHAARHAVSPAARRARRATHRLCAPRTAEPVPCGRRAR